MEKKTNVVVKPSSVSTVDTTHDEDVATATPISIQSEAPSTEQGTYIIK